MPKLYLDIDGILLTARHTQAAPGVEAFVEFITRYFACYRLTTHCQDNGTSARRYLAASLQPATLEKLRVVQPTSWDTLKMDAIDVATDFYWLDDRPFQAEIAYLRANGAADRLLTSLNRTTELLALQVGFQQLLQARVSH